MDAPPIPFRKHYKADIRNDSMQSPAAMCVSQGSQRSKIRERSHHSRQQSTPKQQEASHSGLARDSEYLDMGVAKSENINLTSETKKASVAH